MVKSKKKKRKDVDFQKVKLKIGRKLKKDINETKAEFKSRKIVLKEVRSFSNNPVAALSRHSDHISHQGKLSLLNHFNSAIDHDLAKNLNKPILDSLSKFLIDHSEQVRAAAIRCLKTCYNQLKQLHIPTTEFMLSLRPYLECAYTHVSMPIVNDCRKLLEYFVKINDAHLFEPLMHVIMRRYGSVQATTAEKAIAVQLKSYYIRHVSKQKIEELMKQDTVEPMKWTEEQYTIDMDSHIHNPSSYNCEQRRELTINPQVAREDIVEQFLQSIDDE